MLCVCVCFRVLGAYLPHHIEHRSTTICFLFIYLCFGFLFLLLPLRWLDKNQTKKNGKEEKLYWTTKFGTNLWNESLIDQRAKQKKTPLKKYPTHQLVICFKANGWLMCSTLEKWSTVQQLTIANGICLLCQKIYSQRQAAHNTTHKKITLTYEK